MSNTAQHLAPGPFIRLPELRAAGHWPGCTSGLYAAIKRGDFPAPVKVGPRMSAWVREEVEAHNARLIEQARSEAA